MRARTSLTWERRALIDFYACYSEISRFVTRCADASMMARAEVDTLCVVGIAIIFSRYTYVDALIAVDAIPSVITSARIRVDRVDTSACGFP